MKAILLAICSIASFAAMAQTQVGVIRRFVDNGSDKMSSEPYYGGAVKYGSKPVFIVLKKKLTILPVSSIELTAERTGKYGLLKWKTDASRIELQRSVNGIDFIPIYTGAGNQYLDKYTSYGRNYYRLKAYDKNGSYAYSVVRTVLIAGAETRAMLFNSIGQKVMEGAGDNTDNWKSSGIAHGIYTIRYQLRDGSIYVERFIK